jgi:probable F420-dependent oxidoreductase
MRIDLPLHAPLPAVAEEAHSLRALGADGGFAFEGPHDVFFPLVAAATSGLDLYTNVAVAFPRSPWHLAQQAWDLQAASGGRFALGLGSQVRAHVERRFGAAFDRPVDRMREWVRAVKAIFATWQHGAPLEFRGEFTTHTLHPPLLDPGPLPTGPPPVWVAAVGPRMTRMAAAEADGVMVHPFHSPESLQRDTLPWIEAGLASAGRGRDALALVVGVIVCCGRTGAERAAAEAAGRALLGFYASTPAYRRVLDHHGWGRLQPLAREHTRAGRWDELAALIPDEALDVLTVRGTPAEAGAELRRRYRGVADRVALTLPAPPGPEALAELLGAARGEPVTGGTYTRVEATSVEGTAPGGYGQGGP